MYGDGRLIRPDGYVAIRNPMHPHADSKGYVLEHLAVVEAARHGKQLPASAEVHHIDGNKQNNANSNLVVCENSAYHKLLHKRQRALEECGHVNWWRCPYCEKYDDPKNMQRNSPTGGLEHRTCKLSRNRERWALKYPNSIPRGEQKNPRPRQWDK